MFSSLHVSLLLQLFSANICLFQAAIAVGASYDALVDIFDCVGNFLSPPYLYRDPVHVYYVRYSRENHGRGAFCSGFSHEAGQARTIQ